MARFRDRVRVRVRQKFARRFLMSSPPPGHLRRSSLSVCEKMCSARQVVAKLLCALNYMFPGCIYATAR
jgi:hypothetical protein